MPLKTNNRHWRAVMGIVSLASLPWFLLPQQAGLPEISAITVGIATIVFLNWALKSGLAKWYTNSAPKATVFAMVICGLVGTTMAHLYWMGPALNLFAPQAGLLWLSYLSVLCLGLSFPTLLTSVGVAMSIGFIILAVLIKDLAHYTPVGPVAAFIAAVLAIQWLAPWLSAVHIDEGQASGRGAAAITRRLK